jgi:hypothetical protein
LLMMFCEYADWENWSGREDLNLRPHAPHADLQTAFISLFYIIFIHFFRV